MSDATQGDEIDFARRDWEASNPQPDEQPVEGEPMPDEGPAPDEVPGEDVPEEGPAQVGTGLGRE